MITDENIVDKEEKDNQDADKIIISSNNNEKLVQVLVENDSEKISPYDLGINDRKILFLLNSESELNYYYTFNGLMRKINLHQQSLSRALHRLESLGLIEKTIAGYRIRKKWKLYLSKKYGTDLNTQIKIPVESTGFTQLIQTYIPINTLTYDILAVLTSKWFDTLRWIGLVEGDNEYVLQWLSSNNKIQVNLRILSRYIIVETNAVNDKDITETLISSYKILDYVAKLIKNKIQNPDSVSYEYDLFDQNS